MTWKTEQEQHFLISNLTLNQFLFRHKSHRCNIQPIVEYLVTQVKAINSDYWNKQCAILKYFKSTQNDALVLKADGASRMIEHVHASYLCCTVHEELLSHDGGGTKYNWNSIKQIERKHKEKNSTREE
jgi:hypothetical protein